MIANHTPALPSVPGSVSHSLRPLARRLRHAYGLLPAGELRTAARCARREAAKSLPEFGRVASAVSGEMTDLFIRSAGEVVQLAKLREQDGRELDAVERIARAVEIAGVQRLSWTIEDLAELAKQPADKAQSRLFTEIIDKKTGEIHTRAMRAVKAASDWLPDVSIPGETDEAQFRRICDPAFWRRALRRVLERAIECAYLTAGLVGRGRQEYVSNQTMRIKQGQIAMQDAWLSATHVETMNGSGEKITLPLVELAAKKEKKRRAEFFAFTYGVSELAEADGLVPAMLTLTLPGEWHANPVNGRQSWNGLSPVHAHDELNDRWKCLRAGLLRRGITLTGFRAAEPHADGTPHWHALIYFLPQNQQAIM